MKISKKFKILSAKMQKIPIAIHPLFLLLGAFMFWCGRGFLFVIYTVLALMHELAHLIVARKLGYRLNKIRLMPFGAVLEAEQDEFAPSDEIKISLAGPLFNLLFAVIIVALWWVKPAAYYKTVDIMVANLSCGLFNLIPIYPLDGGRVVLAFLSRKFDRVFAAKLMKKATLTFGLILILIFVVALFYAINFTILAVGIMILACALGEENASYKKITFISAKKKKAVHGLGVKDILFNGNSLCSKVYLKLSASQFNVVLICDDQLNIIGRLTETEISDIVLSGRGKITLNEALALLKVGRQPQKAHYML